MKIVEIQKKVDTEEFYGFGPEYETRFAIAEDDGKIVDDAQGYGYRTKEKAVKAMWWKFKGGESKSNAKVEWWRGNIGLLKRIYKFLDNNAKRDEVIVLPSGLQYEVLKSGDGAKPKATDKVRCHYEGTLIDGTVFDSSYKRGEPAVFGVNQVIAGWVEALQLMEVGSKWRLYIPYKLGYGEHGAGNSIPPYSTLISTWSCSILFNELIKET